MIRLNILAGLGSLLKNRSSVYFLMQFSYQLTELVYSREVLPAKCEIKDNCNCYYTSVGGKTSV